MSRAVAPHPAFILVLTLFVVVQPAPPCWAWGRLGHRVISKLAEQHLTEKAKAGIAALLPSGQSIADASTWADEIRGRQRNTAPWHYVDVPLDEPRYDSKWSADDPKKGCVVDKINEFRKTLKDPSKTKDEKLFALRFLIHCVEDMHMPMHVGDNHDRGGNDTQVRWFDRGMNMHSLWDGGIISRVSSSEDVWLKELTVLASEQNQEDVSTGTPEVWATESLLAAREAYVNPADGTRIKSGTKLGSVYYEKSLPVAKSRMYKAGIRLAKVLNECFDGG
jgi:hypothetical protein